MFHIFNIMGKLSGVVFLIFAVVQCIENGSIISMISADKENEIGAIKAFKSTINLPTHRDTGHRCSSEKSCRCYYGHNKQLLADCSFLNLTHIPETFYFGVTNISLKGNAISNFSTLISDVKHFDAFSISLRSLNVNPFRNLSTLKSLDLSSNNLEYIPSIYHDKVFANLKNLVHLNLKDNNKNNAKISNLPYPESIASIATLEKLYIDGIDTKGFSKAFQNLHNLKELYLGGGEGQCSLGVLRSSYFEYMNSTQRLDISNCNLIRIELGTFSDLRYLISLNISYNINLTFRVLSNVTKDLTNTSIQSLDISKLHCSFGPGTALYKEDIVNLKESNLTQLFIDNNRLSIFEPFALTSLPRSLKNISLRKNRLTFDCYVLRIHESSLETIDMSYQYAHGNYPLSNFNEIKCNDWRTPPNLTSKTCSILNEGRHIVFPPNITHFYGTDIRLNINLNMDLISGLNRLQHMELKNNVLHSWTGKLNSNELAYLDLSNNFCSKVSRDFFSLCRNLTQLFLQHNLLGSIFSVDINGRLLHTLTRLMHLDISFNRIDSIPVNFLKSQSKLKYLNLGNNNLRDLNISVKHMQSLTQLNLSNNKLRAIHKDQRTQLDMIKGNNLSINILGNVLECSCETLDFFEWLESNKKMFVQFDMNYCNFPDGKKKSFKRFSEILTELTKTCSNYTVITAASTSLIVLVIALSVSGVIYRYRWKLRYLFYMSRNKQNSNAMLSVNGDEDDGFLFDAFVSYSEKDGQFIRQELLDNLETKRNMHVCLHQRDFIPGQDIAENIINAIHRSRKTVLVLSKNYLLSYWCMFEFNMAKMESLYSRGGESILMIVFYENIALKSLPLSILDIIESKTYIDYPEDEQGRVVFWNKLAGAISR